MVYKNWENGGKTANEFEDQLRTGVGRKLSDFYEHAIDVIWDTIKEIQDDDNITARMITGTKDNKLVELTEYLSELVARHKKKEEIYDCITATEETAEWLSQKINDAENQTLKNLKAYSGRGILNQLAEDYNITHDWEGYNCNTMVVKGCNQNLNLDIFKDRWIYEWYVYAGTHTLSGTTDYRWADCSKCQFILDYSKCDNNIKEKIKTLLSQQLDEVVCMPESKKRKGNDEDAEYSGVGFDPEKIIIQCDEDGAIQYRVFGDSDASWIAFFQDDFKNFPIAPNLKISELSSYLAGISAEDRNRRKEEKSKLLGNVECTDWDSSPYENGMAQYCHFGKPLSLLECLEGGISDGANVEPPDRSDNYYFNRFIVATENRARTYVRSFIEDKKILRLPEAVDTTSKGLLKVGFYTDETFKDCEYLPFWNEDYVKTDENDNEGFIGSKLYNLIKNNGEYENDYKYYVNERIKSLWKESEHLCQYKEEETSGENVSNDHLITLLYGLNILEPFFYDGMEAGEKGFQAGHHKVRKMIDKINSGKPISYKEVLNLIDEIYNEIMGLLSILHWREDDYKKNLSSIIWGTSKVSQEGKPKKVGNSDAQESAFSRLAARFQRKYGRQAQAQRIEDQRDENGRRRLTIEGNKDLNQCLEKIDKYFSMDEGDIKFDKDGKVNISKTNIVYAYTCRDSRDFEILLKSKGILPNWYNPNFGFGPERNVDPTTGKPTELNTDEPSSIWSINRADLKDSNGEMINCNNLYIKKAIGEIYSNLKSRLNAFGNIKPPTSKQIQDKRDERIKELEGKAYKKDGNDTDRLQRLDYEEQLEYGRLMSCKEHPNDAINIAEIGFENMRSLTCYSGTSDIIFSGLVNCYAKINNKGTNSDIYDSINGFDWYISDTTKNFAIDIAKEAAVTAAIWFLTGGTAIPTILGTIGKLSLSIYRNYGKLRKTVRLVNCIKKMRSFLLAAGPRLGSTAENLVVNPTLQAYNEDKNIWDEICKGFSDNLKFFIIDSITSIVMHSTIPSNSKLFTFSLPSIYSGRNINVRKDLSILRKDLTKNQSQSIIKDGLSVAYNFASGSPKPRPQDLQFSLAYIRANSIKGSEEIKIENIGGKNVVNVDYEEDSRKYYCYNYNSSKRTYVS